MIRRRIQIACFSDCIYVRRGNYLKVSKRTSAAQKNTKEWGKKICEKCICFSVQHFSSPRSAAKRTTQSFVSANAWMRPVCLVSLWPHRTRICWQFLKLQWSKAKETPQKYMQTSLDFLGIRAVMTLRPLFLKVFSWRKGFHTNCLLLWSDAMEIMDMDMDFRWQLHAITLHSMILDHIILDDIG